MPTVVFDLGNTLVPFSFAALKPRLEPCRERIQALSQRAEIGAITPAAFRAAACALTGVDPGKFDAWWCSVFDDRWLIAPRLIGELKQLGWRVGLLSNTSALHYEFLRRTRPELAEFDFQVLSFEAGACKPDPRIFAAVERAAGGGVRPEDIIYFDDIEEYVMAARRRGWQAEVFTGGEADVRRRLGLAQEAERAATPRT
ncbi:MAG TPA: HAD-IA family hydrolase [Terriglobales bacterium]|jgi:putative hydrolase of the HAD superfamily